jgi:transcriptional regulator with XRE-family HTH domain
MVITSELVRAARALLRWEQKDLAEKSGVSLPSIKRLETQPGALAAQPRTVDALRRALEAAGVIFVPGNGDGPGVRLRKAATAETVEALTEKISALKEALPVVDDQAKPSPQKAMRQLERARVKNEIAKVKGKRAKLAPKGDQKP